MLHNREINLWGKEWSVAKTIKEELVNIQEQLEIFNNSLSVLVELQRKKLHI